MCLRWFENELKPRRQSSNNENLGVQRLPVHAGLDTKTSLAWADEIRFGEAPFSAQRVALLLRAIVKKPDLVVLDEAFSGMDVDVRDKCMLFLTWGQTYGYEFYDTPSGRGRRIIQENTSTPLAQEVFRGLSDDQALICVSHVKDEVPGVIRSWMRLPEATSGVPPKFGTLAGPMEGNPTIWDDIWHS